MSTKRETLLSDENVRAISESESEFPDHWRDGFGYAERLYEAARAKDGELIQQLVYWLHRVKSLPDVDADERCWMGDDALAAAAAQGFKPSQE